MFLMSFDTLTVKLVPREVPMKTVPRAVQVHIIHEELGFLTATVKLLVLPGIQLQQQDRLVVHLVIP